MDGRGGWLRTWGPLALIVAGAGVVRFWGLGFGLPLSEVRPDELLIIPRALHLGTGDLNPHFFKYPSFYIYLLFAAYGAYYVLGLGTGRFGGQSDFITEFALDPSRFILIDRAVAALLGTLTVVVVYFIARRVSDKRTGLAAAFFLALAYLHARDSHFGVTDAPVTFLTMAGVYWLLNVFDRGRMRDYLAAGALAGLAASTKYLGALLVFPLLLAHWSAAGPRARLRALGDRRLAAFFIILVVVFFATTPYALLDHQTFLSDFQFQLRETAGDKNLGFFGRAWLFHLRLSLGRGVGPTLLAAAIVGAASSIKRDAKPAAVLWAFPLIYYLVMGQGFRTFVRYMTPLVPFLCIAAALGLDRMTRALAAQSPRLPPAAVRAALAIIIIAPAAWNTIRFDQLIARTDTRVLARDWVMENIPMGSAIYLRALPYGDLKLPPEPAWIEYKLGQKEDEARSRYYRALSDYYVKNGIIGYQVWSFDRKARDFSYLGREASGLPDYIIIESAPAPLGRELPAEVGKLVESSYEEIQTFPSRDPGSSSGIYDPKDAFYLPFAGFGGTIRPGPDIVVYQRR